jgi:hypothetical protein
MFSVSAVTGVTAASAEVCAPGMLWRPAAGQSRNQTGVIFNRLVQKTSFTACGMFDLLTAADFVGSRFYRIYGLF